LAAYAHSARLLLFAYSYASSDSAIGDVLVDLPQSEDAFLLNLCALANAGNAPVQLPVVDSDRDPIQNRGVTDYDGLCFLGMPWHSHLRRLFSDLSRVDDEI
jgi:hypothetical protein